MIATIESTNFSKIKEAIRNQLKNEILLINLQEQFAINQKNKSLRFKIAKEILLTEQENRILAKAISIEEKLQSKTLEQEKEQIYSLHLIELIDRIEVIKRAKSKLNLKNTN